MVLLEIGIATAETPKGLDFLFEVGGVRAADG